LYLRWSVLGNHSLELGKAAMLTATESFKFLIQAAMQLEREGYRPQDGNEDDQTDYDAKIGHLIALWVDETRPDQNAVWLLANILFIHCGYNAIWRFCNDVELLGYDAPYNFSPGSTNLVRDGHRGLNVLGTMDIYDLAANGRKQGWNRTCCPFDITPRFCGTLAGMETIEVNWSVFQLTRLSRSLWWI
jgi:hypothetical protein